MGILEILILAVLGLFCVAFVIHCITGIWHIIYKLAPVAVPFFLLLGYYMYMSGDLNLKEMEVKSANYIEEIKN